MYILSCLKYFSFSNVLLGIDLLSRNLLNLSIEIQSPLKGEIPAEDILKIVVSDVGGQERGIIYLSEATCTPSSLRIATYIKFRLTGTDDLYCSCPVQYFISKKISFSFKHKRVEKIRESVSKLY